MGKTDLDFFPKEFALKYLADEQAIFQSGQPLVNNEEPSIDFAGNKKWLSTTKMPFRDSQGKIKGIVGIGRDITKTKQVELELQQQRDFALQVMNTMGQGLVVTSADDHFEFVNPAFARHPGLLAGGIGWQDLCRAYVP